MFIIKNVGRLINANFAPKMHNYDEYMLIIDILSHFFAKKDRSNNILKKIVKISGLYFTIVLNRSDFFFLKKPKDLLKYLIT